EVRAQGCDDHVGAADGLGGEAGVEDVRADQDLGLAGGRDVRGSAVDGPDLVAALSGEIDDVGADSAGGSEAGGFAGEAVPGLRRGRFARVLAPPPWQSGAMPDPCASGSAAARPRCSPAARWPARRVTHRPTAPPAGASAPARPRTGSPRR